MDYNLLLYCNSQNLTKCYAWFLRTKHHGFDFEFNAINFKTTYWFGKVSELPVSLFLLSASVCDKYLICIHQNIEKKYSEINLWITAEMITLLNLNIEPNICYWSKSTSLSILCPPTSLWLMHCFILILNALLETKKRFLFLLLLIFVKHY